MNLIVAMNEHNVIGDGERLLWNISDDLKRFKSLTVGQIVIMGRKTFDSLPFSTGLPGRINVVLTRDPEKYCAIRGVLYFANEHSLDNILSIVDKQDKLMYVIGGSEIYNMLLSRCNTINITKIFGHPVTDGVKFDCDLSDFLKINESERFKSNDLEFQYQYYIRRTHNTVAHSAWD